MVSYIQGNDDVHFIIQKIMGEKKQYFKDTYRFSVQFWNLFNTYTARIIYVLFLFIYVLHFLCAFFMCYIFEVSGLNSH